MERRKPFCRKIAIYALTLALGTIAQAQYAGGSGTPDDPYLIYTPEQMNAIGADPNDWDKHFKLMADIDLAAYTGTEFNLIGTYSTGRGRGRLIEGFRGVFDGNGHIILNLNYTIEGEGYIGLFRSVGDPNAEIKNLGLLTPNVDAGTEDYVGALAGYLAYGNITNCYVVGGTVHAGNSVGGLVGDSSYEATITNCYSTATVTGGDRIGGLVGQGDTLVCCYADGIVRGNDSVGGLAGNAGTVANCYAEGVVIGTDYVGGLVGDAGLVTNCYAAALVIGKSHMGGLIGRERYSYSDDHVVASFWDMEASMQTTSGGGTGKTTAEMRQLVTFFTWGQADNAGIWTIDEGNDYPRLAWEDRPGTVIGPLDFSGLWPGTGTANDPYLIYTAGQLSLIGRYPQEWEKHYKLMADIDLGAQASRDRCVLGTDQESPFTGTFDGSGHTISNFAYTSSEDDHIGFFGYVEGKDAAIKNLGLITPSINTETAYNSGALVGILVSGTITDCFVRNGVVWGNQTTGGLVGRNRHGVIQNCYATCTVIGNSCTGGLVGYDDGIITHCYAAGVVVGDSCTGGLVGGEDGDPVTASFWDVPISGQNISDAGTGLTTAEMQTAGAFRSWIECGSEAAWTIDEGNDYPRLAWENQPGIPIAATPAADFLTGYGTEDAPYLIDTAQELNRVGWALCDWDKHFRLMADIDLHDAEFNIIGLDQYHPFTGVFDGDGHTISNLTHQSSGGDYVGFFGYVDSPHAQIKNTVLIRPTIDAGTRECVGSLAGCVMNGSVSNCQVEDGRVTGGEYVGGLVGRILVGGSTWNPEKDASVSLSTCRSASTVIGGDCTGGLVGNNWRGKMTNCCATGTVVGNNYAAGLVGYTVGGAITCCYSTGVVDGNDYVGGLVARNGVYRDEEGGCIARSYSTGTVVGNMHAGGLLGYNSAAVSYCVWDIESSQQVDSQGGAGLTTEQMKDAQWLALNGWANDPDWVLDAGRDYPRLAWEGTPGEPIPEPTMDWIAGDGSAATPYEITHPEQLQTIHRASMFWDKHLTLREDIDLLGASWSRPVLPEFSGSLEGRGTLIRNLTVIGKDRVGLIGRLETGAQVRQVGIIDAYVTGTGNEVGILAGENHGLIDQCYSTGLVEGVSLVGGLVGLNWYGEVTHCYSMATVTGESIVGGLVGRQGYSARVNFSYSSGRVSGEALAGGLVGDGSYSAGKCVWDMETSGQVHSAGYAAVGLTTTQIMDAEIVALNGWASDPSWVLDPQCDYPRLAWEQTPGIPIAQPSMDWIAGNGLRTDPYRIVDANQMTIISVAPVLWDCHFALEDHIDLAGLVWHRAVLPQFYGSLDGSGFTIKNLTIAGRANLGLIGSLQSEGRVRNLAVVDADVSGSGRLVGILVGTNRGQISQCYSTGVAAGDGYVGGLVGNNSGEILYCYSHAAARGDYNVGGLVGHDGLGQVMQCYSAGAVSGGNYSLGGLVGAQESTCNSVIQGFWDVGAAGQTRSAGGLGRTTAQMMNPNMYAEAGWDFQGTASDGLHEIWQMPSEGGYPVLSIFHGYEPPVLRGEGTSTSPYLISTAAELGAIVHYDNRACYRLVNDIDLLGVVWSVAVSPYFSGRLDGDGFAVQNLTGHGDNNMGLIGLLDGGKVYGLGVVDALISASGKHAGILVGQNWGAVSHCFSTGTLDGKNYLGGLVGYNAGRIILSHSLADVSGHADVGGLVGSNYYGQVIHCYCAGAVTGGSWTGGLVGRNYGTVDQSFWDMETSGQVDSADGTGLTTAQMADMDTYLNAGWDFLGEEENGLHETWQMPDEGGYPVPSLYYGIEPVSLLGEGTEISPYLISTPEELGAIVYYDRGACYQLANDIDLSGITWSFSAIPELAGSLDGSGCTIYGLTITSMGNNLGLVGELAEGGCIRQLGVVDANITSKGDDIGILAGVNSGLVRQCYTSGMVTADYYVGGLVGYNNKGSISSSYSSGTASGDRYVGGLVGLNREGNILSSYSITTVIGNQVVGGLAGNSWSGGTSSSFWDIETSGQVTSVGGTGLSTAEMMTAGTFLEAGWDFVGETANGMEEVWWIDEGRDYPRLWWEGEF